MGLLNLFKKSDSSTEPKVQSSLDDLPPIPHDQDPGLEVPEPASPSTETPTDAPTHPDNLSADDLPPSPPGETPKSDEPPAELPNLDNPEPAQDAESESLQSEAPAPIDEAASQDDIPSAPVDSSLPQPEESSDASSPVDFTQDVSEESKDTTPTLEVTHDEPHNLPNFDTEPESFAQEPEESSITPEDEERSSIRTESLLLKSIFVEKDHYVSIIAATKSMKEDLQSSGPQQRKLAHVDMKLAKEYSKLSTALENFNENLMVIEGILANEKW